MSGKASSVQEAILKALTQRSLAARYVFAPDNAIRHRGEPADLVWACNNCVILMYMQESKDYPDQAKRERKRQKTIEHNLGQANYWLKAWKAGEDLRGTNGFHTFCITYKPSYHVIVLSIIKCGDAVAVIHDEKAKKLGVACCATLPQSAIEGLAAIGGSTLDLLHLIDEIRKRPAETPVPEAEIMGIIGAIGRTAFDYAKLGDLWPNRLFRE